MVLLIFSLVNSTFTAILWAIYLFIVLATITTIVHDKKEPAKALGWITVAALLPLIGVMLYIFFGRYHRKQKIFNRKEIKDLEQIDRLSEEQLKSIRESSTFEASKIGSHKDIITLLLNNNKSILTVKNSVEILNNGRHTFASLIEAFQSATSSIHIEYYIFENDHIGSRIAKILMDKARKGVEVRFIYDDVGSWDLDRKFTRQLKESGIEVYAFMPVAFPFLTSKFNYRNHRKIVVVDGKIAFTGGINIADRYMKRGRKGMWRDTHVRIEGEAASTLQVIFATDWYFLSKKILNEDRYFPVMDMKIKSEVPIQIASSGPDTDWASIMQAFFSAITRARDHIYISSPYFLPNQAILLALKVAALSGIDVRILIPSRSDSKIVYWASRSYVSELMEAGIHVYLYKRGFNHSKLIMIDSSFGSIGTANMDIRSFEDNFEVSAIIYDETITRQLEAYFMEDLKGSQKLELDTWEKRPRKHQLYEEFSRLLSPLL